MTAVAASGPLKFCPGRFAQAAATLAPTGRKARARESQSHPDGEAMRWASCCNDSGKYQSRTATARWRPGLVKHCNRPALQLVEHLAGETQKLSTEGARPRYHNTDLLLLLGRQPFRSTLAQLTHRCTSISRSRELLGRVELGRTTGLATLAVNSQGDALKPPSTGPRWRSLPHM